MPATAPPSPSLLGSNPPGGGESPPPSGVAVPLPRALGAGLGGCSLRRDDCRRKGLKRPSPKRGQTRAPSAAAAMPLPRRPRLRETACKPPSAAAPGEDAVVRGPCRRPQSLEAASGYAAGEGGHSRGRLRDDASRERVRHAEPWSIAVSGLGPTPLGLKDADGPNRQRMRPPVPLLREELGQLPGRR
jgi:hypothetical protein